MTSACALIDRDLHLPVSDLFGIDRTVNTLLLSWLPSRLHVAWRFSRRLDPGQVCVIKEAPLQLFPNPSVSLSAPKRTPSISRDRLIRRLRDLQCVCVNTKEGVKRCWMNLDSEVGDNTLSHQQGEAELRCGKFAAFKKSSSFPTD